MRDRAPITDRQRFWRLMALMLTLAVTGIAGILVYLRQIGEPLHFHFVMAISLGIGLSMLLAGALMGLVFLSNRSGHDAEVGHDSEEEDE